MKLTIELLSDKDRLLLADLYLDDRYKVLKKLMELQRIEYAKGHVNQKDILDIRFLSGKSEGLKDLNLTLKDNFKNIDKQKS